jgi:hypothetical protein
VYRKTDDGWQQHDGGSWSDVETPERPADGERQSSGDRDLSSLGEGDRAGAAYGNFSREQFDASSHDAAREQAGQRYGGSGSLEGREAPGSNAGTGSRAQQSNYSREQLNREVAARNGGYQNHQRRTAPRRR